VGALAVATSEEVEEVVDGELVVDHSLLPVALAFADLQNSPETQRSYGSVYRTFSTYLGPTATRPRRSPPIGIGSAGAAASPAPSPSTCPL